MTVNGRIDRAFKVIAASPGVLYHAFLDPDQLVQWLPPDGMSARVHALQAEVGGALRLSLYYLKSEGVGKTSNNEDALEARFCELVPDRRIVYDVEFESDDPAFAGTMTQVWTFDPVGQDTKVTITCTNVPEGISAEAHATGLTSTLANLAEFAERDGGDP